MSRDSVIGVRVLVRVSYRTSWRNLKRRKRVV
jgi:hypothetical protein